MALSPAQIDALMHFVAGTKNDEITCDECLAGMAELAELDLSGQEIHEAMLQIRDHVDFCPECTDEYTALLEAVRAIED